MPSTDGSSVGEPLDEYRRKRDFDRTPEPPPVEAGRGGSSFVIQKHDARRLHYDFRLEVDGVLKSWAVPKGPSLDPKVKRLAVPTEDHPLSYGTFEGVIPAGQYGGGAVLLWDRGTFVPKGDPAEGLAKGRLSFELRGEKLRGGFTLFRMSGQEQWLLVKKDDEHADPERDIVAERPESVLGSGTLAEVEAAGTEPVPERVAPMLCQLVDEPPAGDQWLHELKLDGYRMLCRVDHGEATFSSRNGKDWTAKVGERMRAAAASVAETAWLDGELVTFDSEGRTSFREVRAAVNAGDHGRLVYMVFDLLFVDGVDLRERSLSWRKSQLKTLVGDRGPLRFVDHVRGRGPAFLAQAAEMAVEGVVSKAVDSRYVGKRSPSWRKVRLHRTEALVVVGYLPSEGGADHVGSLILASAEGASLSYAGRVGTGFTDAQRRALKLELDDARRTEPSLAEVPALGTKKKPVWVEPRWVAEVRFTEWTAEGRLRHPSFVALRRAGGPDEARDEPPTREEEVGASAAAAVRLSNPNKVLYPEARITKRDLFAYVEEVAEHLLPHVARRPLTLVRCPDGIGGQCFFQKHAMAGHPAAVKTVAIAEKEGKGDYLYVEDAEGLLSLVQLGSLELHVWGSRIDRLERPDRVVFDLDPAPGLDWDAVARAAREVRDVLDTLGLASFPMLTGGKGLHVVVPLERRHDWTEVKAFAGALASRMAAHQPKRYVAKASKAAREGKIFIDYLRNGRGATAIAPFSMRARPGAPVALPIRWDEVGPAGAGDRYDIDSARRRLAALGGDPWEGYAPQRITKAARRALETP